mmetsp:Transcript_88461/g.249309  ORF Transcript_88461/g.249309 Transcript_88461/m.249309 type:complete len:221 (-) Transcript_88461:147-809(-)
MMANQNPRTPTEFRVSAHRMPPQKHDQQQTSMSSVQLNGPCLKPSPSKLSCAASRSTKGLNLCRWYKKAKPTTSKSQTDTHTNGTIAATKNFPAMFSLGCSGSFARRAKNSIPFRTGAKNHALPPAMGEMRHGRDSPGVVSTSPSNLGMAAAVALPVLVSKPTSLSCSATPMTSRSCLVRARRAPATSRPEAGTPSNMATIPSCSSLDRPSLLGIVATSR